MNDIREPRGDVRELRNEASTTPVTGVWARGGPVFSHLTEDTVNGLEGAAIATFGDAASLGMWAFATGSLMAGLFQADLLPSIQASALYPLLLAYPGPAQFIAGLFLYRRNNNFLATAFCSFGAFNTARGALLLCASQGLLPAGAPVDLMQGIMLEVFAYISISLLLGAVQMNVVLVLMLSCTAVGFALSGVSFLTTAGEAGRVGGYFLLATAAFAYYGGSAVLVNTAWRRVLLPLGGMV